jgi:hypothetical protein
MTPKDADHSDYDDDDNGRNDEPHRHGHAVLRTSSAGRAGEQKQDRVHDGGLQAVQVSLPSGGVPEADRLSRRAHCQLWSCPRSAAIHLRIGVAARDCAIFQTIAQTRMPKVVIGTNIPTRPGRSLRAAEAAGRMRSS